MVHRNEREGEREWVNEREREVGRDADKCACYAWSPMCVIERERQTVREGVIDGERDKQTGTEREC